ncbi:hypothetical protein TWF694_002730 [Orbilia ellipsospora]|uniref:F-box domain-containing protein n=1 Tax=Orbilia ellipsospora TaxID=2528407 RepID=A0AAV9X2V0_9PEZI
MESHEPTTEFPFLSLPRELRDAIYEHLLVSEPPPKPSSAKLDNFSNVFLRRDLSIFQTCRQVYEEAAEVFYSKNTFSVKVRIQRYVGGSPPFRKWVLIEHSAPWEQLDFAYVPPLKSSKESNSTDLPIQSTDYIGQYRPSDEFPVGVPFKAATPPPPSTLSIRHGQMIRHVDIEIKVAHVLLFSFTRDETGTYKNFTRYIGARISRFAPRALKTVNVDTSYRLKRLLNMNVTVPFLIQGYRYLMELASPLARGDYRVVTDIDGDLNNLVEEGTVNKIQREVFESEASEEDDELLADIRMEEGCHLATVQGRLFVQPDEALY